MYPKTVAAKRKGRLVNAVVPNAVGENRARANEETKTADQERISLVEKGEGLTMGSASTISVFTKFLTVNAV